MSLGEQLAGIADSMNAAFGDAITLNGEETTAFFTRLSREQVQGELADDDWELPAYRVQLRRETLGSPWYLKTGSVIVWTKRGWTLTVRRLPDIPGLNDADLDCNVIAVIYEDN